MIWFRITGLRVVVLVAICVSQLSFAMNGCETIASASETELKPIVRTVRGEVVAVNMQDGPQVIVVKAIMPNKEELIVSATVESGAIITRGKQRVGLTDVKVGETVVLTYAKNPDGLVVHSIHTK